MCVTSLPDQLMSQSHMCRGRDRETFLRPSVLRDGLSKTLEAVMQYSAYYILVVQGHPRALISETIESA